MRFWKLELDMKAIFDPNLHFQRLIHLNRIFLRERDKELQLLFQGTRICPSNCYPQIVIQLQLTPIIALVLFLKILEHEFVGFVLPDLADWF